MLGGGVARTWRDSPSAHTFYHSSAWSKVRKLVLDRSHGLCEDCIESGRVTPADVVHHETPLNDENVNDPSVSLNPDKLRALCHDCHTARHKQIGIGALRRETNEEPRVGFDADGNVVAIDKPAI